MTQAATTIDLSSPAMKLWRKLPEGVLAEVINDTLYILASSSPYHANISLEIAYQLKRYVDEQGTCKVYHCPVDVHLRKGTVVIPDIVFIAGDNPLTVGSNGLHGVPDLHIEILSPSNRDHDLVTKKQLYESAGVREYWIIDQKTNDCQGYLLNAGKYGEPLVLNSEIYIRILKTKIKF